MNWSAQISIFYEDGRVSMTAAHFEYAGSVDDPVSSVEDLAIAAYRAKYVDPLIAVGIDPGIKQVVVDKHGPGTWL